MSAGDPASGDACGERRELMSIVLFRKGGRLRLVMRSSGEDNVCDSLASLELNNPSLSRSLSYQMSFALPGRPHRLRLDSRASCWEPTLGSSLLLPSLRAKCSRMLVS